MNKLLNIVVISHHYPDLSVIIKYMGAVYKNLDIFGVFELDKSVKTVLSLVNE
jgi:hypothetical protein